LYGLLEPLQSLLKTLAIPPSMRGDRRADAKSDTEYWRAGWGGRRKRSGHGTSLAAYPTVTALLLPEEY
jgi:hypothetical protein